MFKVDRLAKETALKGTTVTVEYTAHGVRTSKSFPNAFAARSFYTAKFKAGAAPKIVSTK